MTANEAPIFTDLSQARQWVYRQSLAEVFYLVRVTIRTVGHDGSSTADCFEFLGEDSIEKMGGKAEFDIIECWS
tara:strand:- start:256 stop:477 length:222 start_codon:yes stop_codon:yes gene_type:complete